LDPELTTTRQLQDAQRGLSDAKQQANGHAETLQERARAFKKEQESIDRRLMVIAASEASDDAVPRFEQVLDTLQRLDVANAYFELLQQVHVLR
jgi:hypothetical protein